MVAPAEALPTGGAREGLLARVCSLMPDEVVPPAEALPTLGAAARPDRGVAPQVLGQRGAVAEAAAALTAQVELLGRVRLAVSQVPPVRAEVLATLATQVGLASKVDSLVCCEHGFLAEAFATNRAEEGFFSRMCPLVPDKV